MWMGSAFVRAGALYPTAQPTVKQFKNRRRGTWCCQHMAIEYMTNDLFILIAYNSDMRKPRTKAGNVEKQIARRIARKRGDVFLRADFSDIGGYDQVGRALRDLVRKGCLLYTSDAAD